MIAHLIRQSIFTLSIASALLAPFTVQAAASWTKVATSALTLSCPSGYIPVSSYALPDSTVVPKFCVMKYEAKQNTTAWGTRNIGGAAGALPVSTAAGLPWVSLTWQDARSACAAAGSQLITDNQWLSLAHQITSVPANWSSGIVGTGFLYSGHNDNAPAGALAADPSDANGYFGTGDGAAAPGDSAFTNYASNVPQAYQGQLRTLTLPNGQVIWDLAGNVWEWTDSTLPIAGAYQGGAAAWLEYTAAPNVPLAKRPPSGYNAAQGMGRYYDGSSTAGAYNSISEAPDLCTGYCAPAAFMRGGYWGDGVGAGAFALHLDVGRSYTGADIGFRCTR